MDHAYNKQNAKDRFILKYLLPYLMKRLESDKGNAQLAKQIASMYVFPYIWRDEIRFGSLLEPDVKWYYIDGDQHTQESEESVRILCDKEIAPKCYEQLVSVFQRNRYLDLYTETTVRDNLIDQMSTETDYTERWWKYAYDLFVLWNDEIYSSEKTRRATESIENNYFLFDERNDGYNYREALIENGVFRDIKTKASNRLFWDKVSQDCEKAYEILKALGVLHTFIVNTNGDYVNPWIRRFARRIGEEVQFPVGEGDADRERCELCSKLFLEEIQGLSDSAFWNTLELENCVLKKGIPIRNCAGEYVPLSWHLFYSNGESTPLETDFQGCVVTTDNKMECRHIDASAFDSSFLMQIETIHAFSEVNESASRYGIDSELAVRFYMWVWNYSQHQSLAEIILSYFSGDQHSRRTVPKENTEFVLRVLNHCETISDNIHFDIYVGHQMIYSHAELVNRISESAKGINIVVYPNQLEKQNVTEILRPVLDSIDAAYETKDRIENDSIWDHVYAATGPERWNDDIYVQSLL